MKDNHTLESMFPLFFLHESYIQISWGLTNAIIDVYNWSLYESILFTFFV